MVMKKKKLSLALLALCTFCRGAAPCLACVWVFPPPLYFTPHGKGGGIRKKRSSGPAG